MTRCKEFYEKLERLKAEGDEEKIKEFCDKSAVMLFQIEAHSEFMKKKILPFTIVNGLKSVSVVPEGATRSLRSESETTQEQVIPKMREALEKGEEVTAPKVIQWINEAKNPDFYNAPTPIECTENVCPTCTKESSLKEEFCPLCPKTCDSEALNCPITAFIKWKEGKQ